MTKEIINASVKPNIRVGVLQYTDIDVVARAIRRCADSEDKLDSVHNMVGDNDLKLIKHCISGGHHSVFEHCVYTFSIDNISRSVLQELSRHRVASPSVQSTRWALKKLLKGSMSDDDILKFIRRVDPVIDEANANQLRFVVDHINEFSNDKLKYALPEAFLTSEILTINARSLWNLLNLRLSSRALYEFRCLAMCMLELVREIHPYLYDHIDY